MRFDMIKQLYLFDIQSDKRAVVTCYPIVACVNISNVFKKIDSSLDIVFSAESFLLLEIYLLCILSVVIRWLASVET
jgi:hypothetical protein